LLLHAGNSPELVALGVLGVEVLVTHGHNSRMYHHHIVGSLFLSEFLLNQFVGLVLRDSICMSLLLKNGEGSLLPILLIVLVIVKENAHVRIFELFDFFFVDNNKDGGHDI
jgi:hypothetical protein